MRASVVHHLINLCCWHFVITTVWTGFTGWCCQLSSPKRLSFTRVAALSVIALPTTRKTLIIGTKFVLFCVVIITRTSVSLLSVSVFGLTFTELGQSFRHPIWLSGLLIMLFHTSIIPEISCVYPIALYSSLFFHPKRILNAPLLPFSFFSNLSDFVIYPRIPWSPAGRVLGSSSLQLPRCCSIDFLIMYCLLPWAYSSTVLKFCI